MLIQLNFDKWYSDWAVTIVLFRLSDAAKASVTSMGSSYFSKISFRDVWLMVGQPNMKEFAAIEEVGFCYLWKD